MNESTATTATNGSNGNGKAAKATETALARLHGEWVAAGSKKPTKASAKPLVDGYKKAKAEREALEGKIAALKAKEDEAAVAIVRAFGKGRFTLDGETFQAASRGDHVFLKREAAAIEL
jgi:hypothetical protein